MRSIVFMEKGNMLRRHQIKGQKNNVSKYGCDIKDRSLNLKDWITWTGLMD